MVFSRKVHKYENNCHDIPEILLKSAINAPNKDYIYVWLAKAEMFLYLQDTSEFRHTKMHEHIRYVEYGIICIFKILFFITNENMHYEEINEV